MNKPLKYKFPTVLLCITLVLAILLTGFTEPGFLLPLIGEKTTKRIDSVSVSRNDSDSGIELKPEGSSKAFSIEPIEGITISAEKNALDKDRDFKLEEVSEDKFFESAKNLSESVEPDGILLGAYELDAGLEDEEVLPGSFRMTFDLEKLGVSPDAYEMLKFYRVDDEGNHYDFAAEINGNTAIIESNQNSLIEIVFGVIVGVGIVAPTYIMADYVDNVRLGILSNGSYNVEIDGKKRFLVYADPKSMRLFLNEAQKGVVSDLCKRAMERTLKEMRDAYGADKINKCIDDKGVFFTKDSLIMKHYNRVLTEYVEMYKRNDPVCQSAQQALQDAADGLEGLSQDDLYPIAKTTDALVTAYDYLKNHVKAEMPNYVVRIDLRTDLGGTSGYTTYEKLIGNPYCVIDVGSTDHIKALPLTLTHELFHAIQRKYVSKPMANFKFDEALAQAVEYEAYEYFTEKKIIDLPKRETLVELYSYDDYALPLDQYSSLRNLTISYPEGTHTAYDTTSCYPAAGLILYLRGIYPDISYTDILKTYGRMWMNGKFTDILKTVYRIDNSGLEAVYYTFAAKDAPYFYASAIERQNDSGFAPKTVVNTREPTEVKGSGQEYVIRVRQINVNKRKSSDEQFALVLLYDKENTEHHLLPVEATEDRHYSNMKNGIFLHPKEFETGKPSTDMIPDFDSSSLKDISPVDWYIIEPNTVPVSASKNQYKIYPVYAPDTPVVDAKDSKLEITFPDPKNSPSYEAAEGYAVKVYSGNEYEGAVTVQFDELDDKFRWTQDDIDLESFENPKITICEYFGKSSDDEELFGPETEKIDLIGGYSGRWVLSGTKSYSEREAFEIEGSKTEKYTANGSTFTSYSESYSKYKDGTYAYRNIDSSTCSFAGIPNSANPGETFTVKAKVTVSQSAYKATGDSKDLGMCCNVTDAEVEKFLNNTWTRDDHVGKTDLDGANVEWDRISDTEDRYAVTFPNEKGDTGKIVIVIEYGYFARTVYTYTWQPMG